MVSIIVESRLQPALPAVFLTSALYSRLDSHDLRRPSFEDNGKFQLLEDCKNSRFQSLNLMRRLSIPQKLLSLNALLSPTHFALGSDSGDAVPSNMATIKLGTFGWQME